jgi:hypothetical protein
MESVHETVSKFDWESIWENALGLFGNKSSEQTSSTPKVPYAVPNEVNQTDLVPAKVYYYGPGQEKNGKTEYPVAIRKDTLVTKKTRDSLENVTGGYIFRGNEPWKK